MGGRGRTLGLLLLGLGPVLPLYTDKEVREYELTDICGDGSKRSLFLGSQGAFIFTFNSTESLTCHLEVHHKVTSDKSLGFSTFIEWIDLEGTTGCPKNSLQFGRDKFIVTNRLSPKYCHNIPLPVRRETEEGTLARWDLGSQSLARRTWTEEGDYEFDIWVNIVPSSPVRGEGRRSRKGLRLVVTPYRKSCNLAEQRSKYSPQYVRCQGSQRCHPSHLLCRDLLKCPVQDREAAEQICAPLSSGQSGMALPLAIIVAVFAVIAVTFLGLGVRLVYQHLTGHPSTTVRREEGPRCQEERQGRESLPLRTVSVSPGGEEGGAVLPLQPPSYSEAVASGAVYKDEPPKYSDIQEVT